MKYFLLSFFLLFGLIIRGQDSLQIKTDDRGDAFFERIIDLPGQKKDEIFLKAKEWFELEKLDKTRKKEKGFLMDTEFKDHGQFTVSFEDKESGKIFGNGRTNILVYNNGGAKINGGSFSYKITTLFKDDKTRIIIDGLRFDGGEAWGVNSGATITEDYPKVFGSLGKGQIRKQWRLMRIQAIKEFDDILSSYEEFVSKKDIKSSDW
jgi:hypothetical protein